MVVQAFFLALLAGHFALGASKIVKVRHMAQAYGLSEGAEYSEDLKEVLPPRVPPHQSAVLRVTDKHYIPEALTTIKTVTHSTKLQFLREASGSTTVHEMQSISSTLVLLLLGLLLGIPLSCCLGLFCCSLCNGSKRQPYKHQLLQDTMASKSPLDIAFRTACLEHFLPMVSELSSKISADSKEGGSGFKKWKLGEVSLASFDVPADGFNLHIKDESDLQVSLEFIKVCCVTNPIEWELPRLRSSGRISVHIDEVAVWFDTAKNGDISDFVAQLVDFELKVYGGFLAFMLNLVKNAFNDRIRKEVEKVMEAQLLAVLQDIGPQLVDAMGGVQEAAALLESLPEEVRENQSLLGDAAAKAGPLLAAGKHEEAKALLAELQKEHPEEVNAALAAAGKQHLLQENAGTINSTVASAGTQQETGVIVDSSPVAGVEESRV